ncbi:hypothetical protein D9M73_190790 [compost metagenome]
MISAAMPRLSPISSTEPATSSGIAPVAFITAAKPAAAIMMKPTWAIRCMPWVTTWSCSRQRITPLSEITAKPTRPPKIIESVHSCTTRASSSDSAIIHTWRRLSFCSAWPRCSPATATSW